CRADLVRRHALRQHADLVPAPAVRLCAVLFARRGAERGQELRHLLGCRALDRPAGDHGGDRDRLPDRGDRPARQAARRRPQQGQDRGAADRTATARFRRRPEAIADVAAPQRKSPGAFAPGFLLIERCRSGWSNQPCALRAMKLSYPSSATWNHWYPLAVNPFSDSRTFLKFGLVAAVSVYNSFVAFRQACMIGGEKECSLVPPANSFFIDGGLS